VCPGYTRGLEYHSTVQYIIGFACPGYTQGNEYQCTVKYSTVPVCPGVLSPSWEGDSSAQLLSLSILLTPLVCCCVAPPCLPRAYFRCTGGVSPCPARKLVDVDPSAPDGAPRVHYLNAYSHLPPDSVRTPGALPTLSPSWHSLALPLPLPLPQPLPLGLARPTPPQATVPAGLPGTGMSRPGFPLGSSDGSEGALYARGQPGIGSTARAQPGIQPGIQPGMASLARVQPGTGSQLAAQGTSGLDPRYSAGPAYGTPGPAPGGADRSGTEAWRPLPALRRDSRQRHPGEFTAPGKPRVHRGGAGARGVG